LGPVMDQRVRELVVISLLAAWPAKHAASLATSARSENHANRKSTEQWNGRSFVRTIKRDYVRVSPCPVADTVMHQLSAWINHYNEVHPRKALGYRSPREFIKAHGTFGGYNSQSVTRPSSCNSRVTIRRFVIFITASMKSVWQLIGRRHWQQRIAWAAREREWWAAPIGSARTG
jgi:Integrase core domain